MNTVQVHFTDFVRHRELTLNLPRDTRFSSLTPVLYEKGFLTPQKPGYRYLYQDHLCGENHLLEDYLPAEAAAMELEIFHYPQIMV